MLEPPAPVLTIQLFPDERRHLLTLLAGLDEGAWERPTHCPGWSVKDVALHLLGDDLNALSRLRDRFRLNTLGPDVDLVAFINRFNDTWVQAARRLSTRLIRDLLGLTGEQTHAYFATLEPYVQGGDVVSWASPEPAPTWLAIAREYTERWVHQQQIREAVRAPLLTERRLFAPVIATFMRALPQTFRGVTAPTSTTISLVVEGDSGGQWSVVSTNAGTWTLYAGAPEAPPAATARMSQDTAWRLFTRGLSDQEAAERVLLHGDARLGRRVLDTVAIVA